MNEELDRLLATALGKINGYEVKMIDFESALKSNRIALEAVMPVLIATHFQIMNIGTQVAALQLAVLSSLDHTHLHALATAIDAQSAKQEEYSTAMNAFFKKIKPLLSQD